LVSRLPIGLQKEQGGGLQAQEDVPEWELYRQQQQKEKRFKFKKGKGKKGAEEEEEVRLAAWLPGLPCPHACLPACLPACLLHFSICVACLSFTAV
jgi:hypothetical protein